MVLPYITIRRALSEVFPFLSFVLFTVLKAHVLDETPLIDTHNDLPYNIRRLVRNNLNNYSFLQNLTTDPIWGTKSCSSCHTDLVRLKAGKVGAQFWVAYVDCELQYKDAVAQTLEQIDVIKRFVQKYGEHLEFATSVDDIKAVFANKKVASLIGVEGGHSMDSRLGLLRIYYELGVRYMTLTHACNTPWADNSYVEDSVHNITPFGESIILEMNRLGMMVDLSHVSHNVMSQAIDVSLAPVIFSHSSAYAIKNHTRNVPDLILKKVMMLLVSKLYKINTIEEVIKFFSNLAHINHIVDIAGINSVGVGSDFDGVPSTPVGLEDVSKYPNLFDYLQQQNMSRWTDENLKLLAAENFLRVFRAVEEIRDQLKFMEPLQAWIPFDDLQEEAGKNEELWKCQTLLNDTYFES
ncbi:hypothetical protein ILUMI_24932 [Ignelater luminosus]|uniref:Dipeptidase n=1 Tax=Ignelater luminosus TaxID=2038154 RepID=A0A8K0C9I2_IGNLU|nr:hypothetical protein ILUMI_24932 [Ignelater luminosus]